MLAYFRDNLGALQPLPWQAPGPPSVAQSFGAEAQVVEQQPHCLAWSSPSSGCRQRGLWRSDFTAPEGDPFPLLQWQPERLWTVFQNRDENPPPHLPPEKSGHHSNDQLCLTTCSASGMRPRHLPSSPPLPLGHASHIGPTDLHSSDPLARSVLPPSSSHSHISLSEPGSPPASSSQALLQRAKQETCRNPSAPARVSFNGF